MEGLAALEQATPDMMIVDYAMPGMNGAEMAQKARVLHPTHAHRVRQRLREETSALESSVADDRTLILRKPFRINDLQDAVTRALDRISEQVSYAINHDRGLVLLVYLHRGRIHLRDRRDRLCRWGLRARAAKLNVGPMGHEPLKPVSAN